MNTTTRRNVGLALIALSVSLVVWHSSGVNVAGLVASPGPFEVVVVVDRRAALPAAQQSALDSKAAADYLGAKAAKDSTGAPSVRRFDVNLTAEQITDDAAIEANFLQAKADAAGKLPWVRIVSPRRVISCAFPSDEAAWLALLKSIGGS